MTSIPFNKLIIGIKGAGEMASGIALRLYKAHFSSIFMMDTPFPQAVRREVSFSDALYDRSKTVEGVKAVRVINEKQVYQAWDDQKIAVAADPQWNLIDALSPDVVIDAILSKKNKGTVIKEANLVIGLGPGFLAGKDVHLVVETNRGHNLGRIIENGAAEPNTGIPGDIDGHTSERVFRSPVDGLFHTNCEIGSFVEKGDVIGRVNKKEIRAKLSGVIRGILRTGTETYPGMKLGDIDPRGNRKFCYSVSDKSRNISGSVLEAMLRIYNMEGKGN